MSEATQPSDRSKLAVTLVAIATATALHLHDGAQFTGAMWVSVVSWVSSAYMLGQVAAIVAQGWTVQAIAKAQGVQK